MMENMNNLVSVIIPVYQAEAYLKECVESVLKQTHQNLEIILVDDGSRDRSGQICDELATREERIRVLHKENGGASSARNAGIRQAQGKYICFVDSDDTVPENAVMALYRAMENTNAHYAAGICGIRGSSKVKNPIETQTVIDFSRDAIKLLDYLTGSGSYSPYAKMFVTKIVRDHDVCYNEELKCSEDALFIRDYLCHCDCMVLVPEKVYEYNMGNETSLSKKGYEMYCEYFIEKLRALERLCDRLKLTEEEKCVFLSCRAIHGLRICANHYLKNWNDREKRKQLVVKSLELLRGWITLEESGVNCLPSGLREWWDKKAEFVRMNAGDKYYSAVEREFQSSERKNAVKKFVKKLLGK